MFFERKTTVLQVEGLSSSLGINVLLEIEQLRIAISTGTEVPDYQFSCVLAILL